MNATVTTEADRIKLKNTIVMDPGLESEDIGEKLFSISEELWLLTPEELGGISQVELTIQDQNGCVMAYYVADYEFGSRRCWTDESIDLWTAMHG